MSAVNFELTARKDGLGGVWETEMMLSEGIGWLEGSLGNK